MARGKKRLTEKAIKQAVTKTNGLLSQAAALLGCDRAGLHRRIQRNLGLKEHLESCREVTLDICENELLNQIKKGNITAIIFYAKTIGKHRGYIEKVEYHGEQEVKHSGSIESRFTLEELETINAILTEQIRNEDENKGAEIPAERLN